MADKVDQWLEAADLAKYRDAFIANDIVFADLQDLTEDDLKEMGLPIGPRRRALRAIAQLRSQSREGQTPSYLDFRSRSPGEGEAERRLLTVMFVDLVGSTSLSAELDPEDLRNVMRRYQDAVVGAVSRYGGHVAKYLGDGVLVYFGWPRAFEDQAERAIRSALDAVAAVQHVRLESERVLQVRIGIASGEVIVGDLVGESAADLEAVSGSTPNLAARLQAAAQPGQVVIGPGTRELVATAFELNPLGSQLLKGFPEPVPAWCILGESSAESRFEAAQAARLTSLVGREHELTILEERWEQAKRGEGQVILLSGEAGIGKSRIVRAVRDLIEQDRHFRLRYQCSPFHANSAFYPIIQRLERAARFSVDDSRDAKLDKLEALLTPSATDLSTTAPLLAALLSLPAEDRYGPLEFSSEQRRDRTFSALIEQVLELSRQRPVLFVVEDAHWIDPTTRDFVGEVARQTSEAAVFMLITHRPEFVAPWAGHKHMTSLALNRLSRAQARQIVGSLAGNKLASDVSERIIERADGVPLFIEELTKAVREVDAPAGSPMALEAVPATLRASLTARLDRLQEAKQIAQIAAAIGREFSSDLIAAVSQAHQQNLEAALDRLVEAELVFRTAAPQGTLYTYKHALIQEVAYDSMLKERRTQLHRHIAEVLEQDFPNMIKTDPEVLGRHYASAGVFDKAIGYWRSAGELATDASANVEAVNHFETAIDLLENLPEGTTRDSLELDLRIALGGPLLMTRGHGAPEVGETYAKARTLSQKLHRSPQIVPALFGMWRFYIGRGDCVLTQDLGRQILDLGKESNDLPATVLGHYGLGFSLLCYGDLHGARRQLENGYKLYDQSMRDNLSFRLGQDPGVACQSYCALALWVLGYPDLAKQVTEQALSLAEELSHPFSKAYALSLACQVFQLRGEPEDVLLLSEKAISISQEHGFAVWIASPTIFKGWAKARLGCAEDGAKECREGIRAIVDAGMEMRRPYYLALLGESLIAADKCGEAQAVLVDALSVVAQTDEHWSEAELLRLIGEIEARSNTAAAEDRLTDALDLARRQAAKSWELRAATSLAALWQRQDRLEDARNMLKPTMDCFAEGYDTPDLLSAQTLLKDLE